MLCRQQCSEVSKTLNLYIDESGNTGDNLLDKDQPLFVYGGWIIQDDYLSEVQDDLIHLPGRTSEIHYKTLSTLQAIAANKLITKYINKMIDAQQFGSMKVLPILAIADKKRIMCDYFMYSVFDSYYNKKKYKEFVDLLSSDKTIVHIKLQESIIELFKNNSAMMAKLYMLYLGKELNPENALEECIQLLKGINIFPNRTDYEEYYIRFLDTVDRKQILSDFCRDEKEDLYSSALAPLILPALLKTAEDLAIDANKKVNVYTDNDTRRVIAMSWKALNDHVLNRKDANRSPILYKYVKQIKMQDSKYSFGIQLADILCSSVNEYLKINSGLYTSRYKRKNLNNTKHQQYKQALENTCQSLCKLQIDYNIDLVKWF